MYSLRALSRTFFFAIILGLLAPPGPLLAQNQTNDPLVDEQQYLFDVHNVDQAWNYTTGSSNVRIGVYSFLGFTSNHEDLNGPRLQTPRGPLRPGLDYATEVAGIAGAVTNNNLGVAGIDRASELQSYSMLHTNPSGHKDEKKVTVDGETFYLDLLRVADRFREGRNNGVDVHLSLIGVPSGLDIDYEDPLPIDTTNYPPMLPNPDSLAPDPSFGIDAAEKELRRTAFQTIKDLFLNVWTKELCFGSGCTSPPPPAADFRQAVGNATRLDGDIVVTPTGDLAGPTSSSNLPVSPGRLGRYVVTVGGLQRDGGGDIVQWERSNAAPYIDVAGFAEGLVGPVAMGYSAYNTEFTGTAGAAGIGAGVASLLRAENSNFTSEDVEQILRRTAKDVGAPGFDNATGAGRIDAGAALSYVNNNDMQRSTKSPSVIIDKQTVSGYTDVTLQNSGYTNYAPDYCPDDGTVKGYADLKKFTARIPYNETFSSAPDVWIRWSGSNGYQTSRTDGVYSFDQFAKDLKVVDIKGHQFIVEGYYWVADFKSLGFQCAEGIRIPKRPKNFKIAYTAVGTEGPPPLYDVFASGPTTLDEGEQGTWSASPSPSSSTPSYTWFADEGSGWDQIGTGSSVTWGKDFISSTITVDIKVEASEGGNTVSAQTSVIINNNDGGGGGGGGGGGCNAPGGNQICLAVDGKPFLLRDVEAEAKENSIASVRWQASGSEVPSEFVVQHRADSTAAWSTLGTVPAGDSSSVESSQGRRLSAYRFRTGELEIGTHQFRVGLPDGTGSGPRAVGTNGDDTPQRFAGPVTAKIKMDEAYRLSAYPNPAREQATVELAVKERQEVSVRLYDVLGRRVATLHSGPLPAQELRRLRLDVSATGLTSGTYFLRVRGEDFAATEQMTVVR